MTGFLASLVGAGNTGVAAGLPAGQNLVEGTEASLMVGAAAANSSWRKAWVALGFALLTLAPYLAGIWFLYEYEPGQYIDYGVAVLIFAIGVHEVMEGLKDRSQKGQARRVVLDGPLGIDPSDASQVRSFQAERGLEQDGVLGPGTRGAVLAELRHRGEEPRPNRLGVDVTHEASVQAFQRRAGLRADGVVGPRTQGALRTFAVAGRDGASATTDGGRAEDGESVLATYGVDLTSADAVGAFQEERGLLQSGVVDETTQGALRAEVELRNHRLGPDPTDADAVRHFQAAHRLAATGVVDETTQEAIRTEGALVPLTSPAQRTVLGVDPTDAGSITAYQRDHGLAESGEIDAATQAELRHAVAKRTGTSGAEENEVNGDEGEQGFLATYKDAWPAYFGFLLEGGEAGLFTIGVAHGTGAWYTAAIAGGSAFALPWVGLVTLRSWIESWPKWVFELTIGVILAAAATIFGLFRVTGIFGA